MAKIKEEDPYRDSSEVMQSVKLISRSATDLIIANDIDFAGAVDMLARISNAKKKIDVFFNEGIKKAREAYNHLTKQKKSYTSPLDDADKHLRSQISSYESFKESKRDEELKRIKLLMENQNAIRGAFNEQIEAHDRNLLSQAAKSVVMSPKTKVETDLATCKVVVTYKAEVVDFDLLVKSVACGDVPLKMLEPNQKLLDKMAGSLRGSFFFPGVKVVQVHTPYLFTKSSDEEIEL